MRVDANYDISRGFCDHQVFGRRGSLDVCTANVANEFGLLTELFRRVAAIVVDDHDLVAIDQMKRAEMLHGEEQCIKVVVGCHTDCDVQYRYPRSTYVE